MNAKTNTNQLILTEKKKKQLFWACFVSLMATSFAFMVRAMLISTWGRQFNLSNTQLGEIMGVGLWPFALSIVLLSLVIDKIGYGRAMIFAFIPCGLYHYSHVCKRILDALPGNIYFSTGKRYC
jgi:MFS family permease